MLIPSYFSIAKIEQSNIHLLLQCSPHLLLSQLIEKLMGKSLSGIESLLWWIYHDLREEVEEQCICFGENGFPLSLFYLWEFVVI